jgi:hypothetical protein
MQRSGKKKVSETAVTCYDVRTVRRESLTSRRLCFALSSPKPHGVLQNLIPVGCLQNESPEESRLDSRQGQKLADRFRRPLSYLFSVAAGVLKLTITAIHFRG